MKFSLGSFINKTTCYIKLRIDILNCDLIKVNFGNFLFKDLKSFRYQDNPVLFEEYFDERSEIP